MFGERIRKCRESLNMSQEELARALQIPRQMISYYETESRKPNINDIVRIATTLNTSADYLLGLSEAVTTDISIKEICDYTGLSDAAVNILHERKVPMLSGSIGNSFLAVINYLIEQEASCLNENMESITTQPQILSHIETYLSAGFNSNEYMLISKSGKIIPDNWNEVDNVDDLLATAGQSMDCIIKQIVLSSIIDELKAARDDFRAKHS